MAVIINMPLDKEQIVNVFSQELDKLIDGREVVSFSLGLEVNMESPVIVSSTVREYHAKQETE